jgi:hypothetical protein
MSIKRHLAVGFALASGVVALTGSAFAAPPGTPPGQEKKAEEAAATPAPAAPATQPAQAAPAEKTAPGQEKKAETAPATAPAPAATSTGGKASAPGQAKKATTSSSTSSSSSSAKTQGVSSSQAGVKPSNDTTKQTTCFTGGAMPSPSCTGGTVSSNAGGTRAAGNDFSKRYGNGSTAAQVAVSRGAPANTEIRGPGNSQPHKVCGQNGNWVDVHAVKSYVGICSDTASTPAPTPTIVTVPTTVSCPSATVLSTLVGHETGNGKIVWISPNASSSHFTHGDAVQVTLTLATGATCSVAVQTPTVTQAMPVVTQVATTIERALGTTVVSTTATPPAAASAVSPAVAVSSTPAPGGVAGAAGGVAGVQETQTAGGAPGGVAGAFGVLGQAAGGTLPFTGFPVWLAVLIAIVLIAMGWTLWRRGRPAATRDVV